MQPLLSHETAKEASNKRTLIGTHHLLTSHFKGSNCVFLNFYEKNNVFYHTHLRNIFNVMLQISLFSIFPQCSAKYKIPQKSDSPTTTAYKLGNIIIRMSKECAILAERMMVINRKHSHGKWKLSVQQCVISNTKSIQLSIPVCL